ncbi:ABC transporter substrate-binding protein [Paenibacillus sp. SYP-B3998]|uniref:ABC transporter substrate-binding protein n=1 Tax=Paenibacillus sp. SYP-B3998 TaxID=2678564 RepID=A0A6G4A0L0_9BACL|nr:ABC transporter substrate-binding protein [Paenibacillus sp. SYP-B3998]NEW07359.1 ABC transporter substrate-binding protein [Paenibacillus sp. SYP-B3998]
MKRNRSLLTVGLLTLVMVASACSGAPTEESKTASSDSKVGGNLIVAIKDDPKTFNPIYAGDRMSLTIDQSLYAPFFSINNGKKTFVLAESLTPTADLTKYTMKLRSGLTWHDGQKLTADDVVFTFNSLLDEKQHSYFRSLFVLDGKPIQVSKVDELTVDFVLPQATAAFEGALVQIFPIPKHIFEGEADMEKSAKNNKPIGSGPFQFKDYRPGEYIMLTRYDNYFAGKAKLDAITYRVAKDSNTAVLALQNGEVNMMMIEPQDYNKVKETGKTNIVMFPSGGVTSLVFNVNIDVMKKKEVRQAIVQALDKKELITTGFSSTDFAEPASSIFTPDTLYQKKDLKAYTYNPEKAKELLKAAGAEGLKIRFAYFNASKTEANMALYVQQKLKAIGVEVELIPLDGAALGKKALNKDNTDYDMSFGGYSMGFEPDAYKPLYLSNGSYNYSHYKSEEFDKLWIKAAVETDVTKRADLYQKIQDISAEEVTTYPIAYGKSIVAVDTKFGGLEEAVPKQVVLFDDYAKIFMK